MKQRIAIALTILLTVILAACSVEISDAPSATSTPAQSEEPTETPETDTSETNDPTATPAAADETAEPTEAADGDDTDTPMEPDEAAPTAGPTATIAPPPWANLNLTGSLIYIAFEDEVQTLFRLNLATGQRDVILSPPENAFLTDVAASPDGSQLLMAYAAPPEEEGGVQFGFTDLYLMPADGSAEPTLLLERAEASETFFNISWPVDDYVYYAHFAPATDDLGAVVYTSQVERLRLSDNTVEVLVNAAAWPRISDDGNLLAYVTDSNEMMLANADGSDPQLLIEPDIFPAVDAPLFAPDNEYLYFSAIDPEGDTSISFWDWLLGVKVASAHTVPSDWWRVPLDGSAEPERLTSLYEIGMYGAFGPDNEWIGFITSSGIQVMQPDGTNLFRLRNLPATGTVSWVE